MPPIKGRMMGLQQASRCGLQNTSYEQPKLDFPSIKNMCGPRKKASFNGRTTVKSGQMKTVREEQLKKLRYPSAICRVLPSVKKFSNGRDFLDITDDDDMKSENVGDQHSEPILGLKKGRGPENKYHIQALAEKRFTGMVWDMLFNPHAGDTQIIVACGSAVYLCDETLNKRKELEKIRLAGGIGLLSSGHIIALCRFMDIVNVYSPAGDFLREFPCGKSPMTLAVNSHDEILITDCSTKDISFYDSEGKVLRTIASSGVGYNLKWPLYMSVFSNDDFLVVDCHQQTALVFDQQGSYSRSIPLRTFGGNEVLRPHGVCLAPDQDLFVIDNAIDTVEVFTKKGLYLQTLIPSEVGAEFRPKIVACSGDGKTGFVAVGGMKGQIRIFKFVEAKDAKLELTQEVKVKPEVKVEVKREIKMEDDDVTVIILD